MCRHLMNCNIELCPDQCLVSVRFLRSAIMDCYFILRIFPVPASSTSLCRCHCTCILSCGCVGVCVRRYCCGFRSMSLKIGYRTLNCILHFWSLILVSIFLCLGLLKIFSKSFCCSYFVYSFLFGIRLCRLVFWSVLYIYTTLFHQTCGSRKYNKWNKINIKYVARV